MRQSHINFRESLSQNKEHLRELVLGLAAE